MTSTEHSSSASKMFASHTFKVLISQVTTSSSTSRLSDMDRCKSTGRQKHETPKSAPPLLHVGVVVQRDRGRETERQRERERAHVARKESSMLGNRADSIDK